MNLKSIERYKLYKRFEYYLSFAIIVIPVILVLSMRYSELGFQVSYTAENPMSIFSIAVAAFGMANSLGVYHLIIGILASNIYSHEIESGYYMMYFPKIESTKKLYMAKLRVLIESLLVHFGLFMLSGIIFGFLFIQESQVTTRAFLGDQDLFFICNFTALVFEMLTFAAIVYTSGLYLKVMQNIMFSVALFVLQKFLRGVNFIKYLLPAYYLNNLSNLPITDKESIIKQTLLILGICPVYIIIACLTGRKKRFK